MTSVECDPGAVHTANTDRYRPKPPERLAEFLRGYAGGGELGLAADVDCGTGLSSHHWAGHAVRVIGIDPRRRYACPGSPTS